MTAALISLEPDTRRGFRDTDPERRRSPAVRDAHSTLRAELIDALLHDPQRLVSTPGFNDPSMPALDVVLDYFSGVNPKAENVFHEILRIVGQVASGDLTSETRCELQLRAAASIAAMADSHAAWHRDDLVIKEAEES